MPMATNQLIPSIKILVCNYCGKSRSQANGIPFHPLIFSAARQIYDETSFRQSNRLVLCHAHDLRTFETCGAQFAQSEHVPRVTMATVDSLMVSDLLIFIIIIIHFSNQHHQVLSVVIWHHELIARQKTICKHLAIVFYLRLKKWKQILFYFCIRNLSI